MITDKIISTYPLQLMESEYPMCLTKNNDMAEMNMAPQTGAHKKHHSLKIDMTPMVDLGFLLITFFIFTNSMTESKAMKLFMPTDGIAQYLAQSSAITVLLGKNNEIYYYEGKWNEAIDQKRIIQTNYDVQNGLGKLLRNNLKRSTANQISSMLLIKPGADATYDNIVNVLDEVVINGLAKYAIVELTNEERNFLKQH